jgi:hypothetical protein
MQEWMRWEPSRGRRWSSLLLTPARVVVGIGAGAAVVAGFMPWAEGTAPGHTQLEPVFFSGLGGAGDGVVLILVAAAVAGLTLHRTPATSRVRTVRIAPAILVVLAAATWANGYRAALDAVTAWGRQGGSGGLAPGLWLAGAGILLMAAGTLRLMPEVLRWERRSDDPADVVTVGARDVVVVVGGIAGTFLGGVAGIEAVLAITGPMIVGAIALGAVFGGLVGAYAGSWAARLVLDRLAGGRLGA